MELEAFQATEGMEYLAWLNDSSESVGDAVPRSAPVSPVDEWELSSTDVSLGSMDDSRLRRSTTRGISKASKHVGRRLSRSTNFSFVDETKQFSKSSFSSGRLAPKLKRGSTGTSILPRRQFISESTLNVNVLRPYLNGHTLISTEEEKKIFWKALEADKSTHTEILAALQRQDMQAFERLLHAALLSIQRKYQRHHSFWLDYFTADFQRRLKEYFSKDATFLQTSMSGFDPRSTKAAELLADAMDLTHSSPFRRPSSSSDTM